MLHSSIGAIPSTINRQISGLPRFKSIRLQNCMIASRAIFGIVVTAWSALVAPSVAAADEFPSVLTSFPTTADANLSPRPDSWDKAFRERGSIVRLDDGQLWLYYTGYDGTREGIKQIGLAISTDSGQSWTRAHDQPVTPQDLWTEDPFVYRDGNQWLMVAEGLEDQAHLLTSTDGVHWIAAGPLDVRLTTGEKIPPGPYGTPTLFKHKDVWHLFYERRDLGVWLATSKDLNVWTNVSDEPVLPLGESGFDAAMIALNQVIEFEGLYYAYYHGADRVEKPRDWAVGVAVSDDLRNWTRFSGNPITDPKANVSSGSIVFTDGPNFPPTLFTTHGTVRIHRSE